MREDLFEGDSCALSNRWRVADHLMDRLVVAANDFHAETRRTVSIISGYRTRAEQDALRRRGRPAASDDTSTHRTCPSTGVDVSLGFGVVQTEKQIWGRILFMNGLRWGGGSKLDSNGIPSDWQHVDLGPR